MAKHPTSKSRNRRQKIKASYIKAREDAQLAGLIATTPEGAVRDEKVDPSTQGSQPLPDIALMAIDGDRKGTWRVPAEKKQELIREMVDIIEAQGETAPPAAVKVMAFNALVKGDQLQYERDNPDAAGRAKGSTNVNVGVQTNVFDNIKELIEKAREQREIIKVQSPDEEIRDDTKV